MSLDGAALELYGVTILEDLQGPLQVRIRSIVSDEVGMLVRAILRHSAKSDGRVIVGVEFSVLRDEERSLLQLMVGLRSLE